MVKMKFHLFYNQDYNRDNHKKLFFMVRDLYCSRLTSKFRLENKELRSVEIF
jgi:hypothetical protein